MLCMSDNRLMTPLAGRSTRQEWLRRVGNEPDGEYSG